MYIPKYADITDLEIAVRAANIADLSNEGQADKTDANSIVVLSFIEAAESLMDTFISRRYNLPLLLLPDPDTDNARRARVMLKGIATDFSIYGVYSRVYDHEIPPAVQKRYDNALKMLTDLRDGAIDLALVEPSQAVAFSGSDAQVIERPIMFDSRLRRTL